MARRNQYSAAKRHREIEKKRKAREKAEKRERRKQEGAEGPSGSVVGNDERFAAEPAPSEAPPVSEDRASPDDRRSDEG